jgi:hypothetical protein
MTAGIWRSGFGNACPFSSKAFQNKSDSLLVLAFFH